MIKFYDSQTFLSKIIYEVGCEYIVPFDFAPVCVDVGSNLGGFTIKNYDKFGKILCIEASMQNYIQSKNYFQENNMYEKVEIIRKAAYSESGRVLKLKGYCEDINGNYSCGNSSVTNYTDGEHGYHEKSDNTEEVESISLEEIKSKVGRINYLKVDIECGEYDFLMNKDLTNIDFICGEFHLQLKNKRKELLEYILSSGFETNYDINNISIHNHISLLFRRKE